MATKKVIGIFTIENDLQEHKLVSHLESLGRGFIIVKPDDRHLQQDPTYKRLKKLKKEASDELYEFIDKNRLY